MAVMTSANYEVSISTNTASTRDKATHRNNTIARDVAMVRHCVQTRARPTLVALLEVRGLKSMVSGDCAT